jgi:hypothetical protein
MPGERMERSMEYATKKIKLSRGAVRAQEARVARQRAKVEQAMANRHPADELQARLLIMEQSLIAMARFLRGLERDLADDLGIPHHQTQKRIKSAKKAAARAEPDAPVPAPAAAAIFSVPVPNEGTAVPFDTLVKAMRKLTDH